MLDLFSYGPVFRGFIVLLISGFTFPITGVYLLRMNLLPLRFMLMHGALLGGAIALAIHINPLLSTLVINLLLVLFMAKSARSLKTDMGYMSIFIMVASIGLAFTLISIFDVQAKDTLSLLWGSIFTVDVIQTIGFILIAIIVLLFHCIKYRQLKAIFFDTTVAYSSGVDEKSLQNMVVLLTAMTVAVAMKLIGALLIDAVIILPALIATFHARSFRQVVLWASIWGGIFSITGFFTSYYMKIPTSSAIALVATVVFVIIYILRKFSRLRK